MKLTYRVHRATRHDHSTKLILADGRKITALIPVLIVELLPDGHHAEAGVVRLAVDKDVPAASVLFQEGKTVTLNIEEGA